MTGSDVFATYIELLPRIKDLHKRDTDIYNIMYSSLKGIIENEYSKNNAEHDFAPFGKVYFPFKEMGNVNTLNLFDLDEVIIFSYYWKSRNLYKKVADLGANLGLHSILLSKCGFETRSYEPDTVHFEILKDNLDKNGSRGEIFNCAVSDRNGEVDFIRVLDNTTGSHIAGAKKNPYGNLETIKVKIVEFSEILDWADLLKIDVEGHEVNLLSSVCVEKFEGKDLLLEISSEENSKAVFEYFINSKTKMYSQKNLWAQVRKIEEMPTSYKEGTLFLSSSREPF